MPRVQPVSGSSNVGAYRQARKVQQVRSDAIQIHQRSEEARRKVSRKAVEAEQRQAATGPGSQIDVQA